MPAIRSRPSESSGEGLAPETPFALRRAHLAFVHSEIMGHFVPDRILHQLRQMFRTARRALVRRLKNRDAVGHAERIEYAPNCQRPAFIETEQRSSPRHTSTRQLRCARFILDDERNILHAATEMIRNQVPC